MKTVTLFIAKDENDEYAFYIYDKEIGTVILICSESDSRDSCTQRLRTRKPYGRRQIVLIKDLLLKCDIGLYDADLVVNKRYRDNNAYLARKVGIELCCLSQVAERLMNTTASNINVVAGKKVKRNNRKR